MNPAHLLRHRMIPIALVSIWLGPLASFAAELKLRAQLAWGTDDSKPPGQDLKELDPKLREKFRHLRWKNYFVVKSEVGSVPVKTPKRFTLSEKCAVDLMDSGDGNVLISVFSLHPGSPPSLVKSEPFPIEKLKAGHVFAFGGETKEKWDDAWLVVVTSDE
jgi:hypothetical protein